MSAHGRRGQRRARAQLLDQHEHGDPCGRCGWPMVEPPEELDADHLAVPLAADPGGLPDALSHARCNRYAGRVLQLLMRGHVPPLHVDPQLETVRRHVLDEARGLNLPVMAAAAGVGPETLQSRDW